MENQLLQTTKELWDASVGTYSDMGNSTQVSGIRTKVCSTKQGNGGVTTYWNTKVGKRLLVYFWNQLDILDEFECECAGDSSCYRDWREESVVEFLAGLNQKLDEVGGECVL